MKTNGDDAAFAVQSTEFYPGSFGLSKREYFAAMALQGILASDLLQRSADKLSKTAEDSSRISARMATKMAD